MITAIIYHTFTGPHRISMAITKLFRRPGHTNLVNGHQINYDTTGAECACGAHWTDDNHMLTAIAEHLTGTRVPGGWVHPDTLTHPAVTQ